MKADFAIIVLVGGVDAITPKITARDELGHTSWYTSTYSTTCTSLQTTESSVPCSAPWTWTNTAPTPVTTTETCSLPGTVTTVTTTIPAHTTSTCYITYYTTSTVTEWTTYVTWTTSTSYTVDTLYTTSTDLDYTTSTDVSYSTSINTLNDTLYTTRTDLDYSTSTEISYSTSINTVTDTIHSTLTLTTLDVSTTTQTLHTTETAYTTQTDTIFVTDTSYTTDISNFTNYFSLYLTLTKTYLTTQTSEYASTDFTTQTISGSTTILTSKAIVTSTRVFPATSTTVVQTTSTAIDYTTHTANSEVTLTSIYVLTSALIPTTVTLSGSTVTKSVILPSPTTVTSLLVTTLLPTTTEVIITSPPLTTCPLIGPYPTPDSSICGGNTCKVGIELGAFVQWSFYSSMPPLVTELVFINPSAHATCITTSCNTDIFKSFYSTSVTSCAYPPCPSNSVDCDCNLIVGPIRLPSGRTTSITQSGPGGYNLILGPTAEAVNIPTVSCGTAGCLSSLSTVLFTELVYTGMVNSTTFPAAYGSISTDYFLPQLTSYFPAGNPLASCTTLSLIEYTPNAQSVLQKRNDINQQNSQTYVWPGANSLTSTSTLTFRAGHSVSLTSTIPPSTTSFSPSTSPTSVSSSTSPTISSHKSSTASRTSTPPSSGIITIGTSTAPIVPPSLTGIGTVTLTQTVYYNISSVENSLPLSGTFVCNTAGCTRASDAGITTNTSGASSISTAANTSTNGAKKLTQPLVRVILAALLLALTGIL